MKLNKKFILGIATMATIGAPVATVISCGTTKAAHQYITNIKKYDGLKVKDAAKDLKAVLITDAGKIDDKSFNQSAYEAGLTIQGQISMPKIKHIQPPSTDAIADSYKAALEGGYKVWILPGFEHASKLAQFYDENKAKMADVTIIGIDFGNVLEYGAEGSKTQVTIDNMYGLQYDTQEAAYLSGVAAAKYLALAKDDTPLVGTFGGGDFSGVTKFNHGFLEGVYAYDQSDTSLNIKYAGTEIDLDTGFSDTTKFKTAIDALKTKNADIVLPVAGPATGTVLSDSDVKVIGVDTDQRISYDNSDSRFLTSVKKGTGQSTYDVLVKIFTDHEINIDKGSTTKGLADNWVSIETSTPANDLYKQALAFASEAAWKTKAEDHGATGSWFLKKEMTSDNKADLETLIAEINK